MPNETNGDWDSCKMFVLNELKRMNDWLATISHDINDITNQMTAMKVKMALIGSAAGIIVSIIVGLFMKSVK